MLCPICRQELISTGFACLETLSEHVMCLEPSSKPKYECCNPACIANQDGLVWSEGGEYFGAKERENWHKKYPFIDGNDGPFGTIARCLNVEIYKKDENWTLMNLYFIRFEVKYLYKADEDGNVLKRKAKIDIWKRGRLPGAWTLYTSGLHMLIYSLRTGIEAYKQYQKDPNTADEFREVLQYGKWDKRWWHLVSVWLLRLAFGKKLSE